MKHFLLILLCLHSFPSFATEKNKETCLEQGKVRYRSFGKIIIENSSYCFNEDRNRLISKNCRDQHNKCLALTQKRIKEDNKNLISQFGSPGFKLCYSYKGKPQLLEFTDGKEWFPLDRCSFEKDNSYINTGWFYKIMMSK